MSKTDWIIDIRKRTVDPVCESQIYLDFLRWSAGVTGDPHYLRNCQTIACLLNHTDVLHRPNIRVLETGGLSLVGRFLRDSGFYVQTTHSDLRHKIDASPRSMDLILSLEVIEHLKDHDSDELKDIVLFNRSGALSYCRELARVARSGATLLLTTPNPCSLRVLQNLLAYKPPAIFRPHVREYTRSEIENMLGEVGFAIRAYEARFAFFNLGVVGVKEAQRVFGAIGASAEGRGDNQIIVSVKEGWS